MRLAFLALALIAAPAAAQQPGVPAPEAAQAAPPAPAAAPRADPRINQLIIYGDDPCPQSSDSEIIVCARLPEGDRYRIPPTVRDNPNAPANQSWANQAIELSYVGRSGIGSCTPSGPGGMIGCLNQIFDQARAERADRGDINWVRAIEQARQERMRRIGEAQVEEDQDTQNQQAAPQPAPQD
jgi:hypothetical protein